MITLNGQKNLPTSHHFLLLVIEDASNSMRNEECVEFGGVLLRNRKTPSSKTYQLTFDDSIR
ncbi:Speckle-type POZ/sw-like protein [Daphnia magna]|uniref:Speckle-type POZ/sw-like protein n=1 Tax=Daphnia magna TaxID=35525 RepID=A0A164L1A6_9CRUS|nr:Speckle-type POZ/sw-like protein [Daphnia magna]